MSARILLVDDHPIVLDGLRSVLGAHSDLQIVGEAGDGLEVLPMVERLRPDIVVLDLILPGLGGLEVTRRIRKKVPQTQIIILSMHAIEAYVAEALYAGARAYVLKRSASMELIEAIRAVFAGKRYLSKPFSNDILESYKKLKEQETPDTYQTLTTRERDILHMVVQGFTNREISQRLGISYRTVETHRANMMDKLGLHTTAELVGYAIQRGISLPN